MRGLNRVFLIGNVGQDPDVKYTAQGTATVTLSLATNETFTRDGEQQTRTEWHRVVVWGKLAEVCGEYVSKGTPLCIEGRLRTRSWEDREGVKRYVTEVVATGLTMLGQGQAREERPPADDDIPF